MNGGPGEALCMHNRMSNSQINNSSANQTAITDNNRHDEINLQNLWSEYRWYTHHLFQKI